MHRIVLPSGIDMGLDFPKSLRFCPDCFELSIGCIVLPFQFCVLCFQCFTVVLAVRKFLRNNPTGFIEAFQIMGVFCLVLLSGFGEFDFL